MCFVFFYCNYKITIFKTLHTFLGQYRGDFGSGFLAGAVSSLVSSGVEALGNGGKEFCINDSGKEVVSSTIGSRNPTLLKAIMITSGGLSGGYSSWIAGGSPDSYREQRHVRGIDNEWVESCSLK